jgi:uncharacterized protein (DUF488 family)
MNGGFATIGHSNRSVETVIGMLREARIKLLIDVRTFPKSRNFPGFNGDSFSEVLADHQMGYLHMPALGGRRPKQPNVDEPLNAFWRVRGFHNYADYALSPTFQNAFHELVELGRHRSVALMCSEAVWWRCHRRIITDYLLLNGHEVRHLMAPGRVDMAEPSEGARLQKDGTLFYPPP